MGSLSRGLAAVLVGALVMALGLTASAVGHTRLYNASISITLSKAPPGHDTASGTLVSKGLCLGGRTVTVTEDPNTGVAGDQTEVGRTITTATGAWSLEVQGGIKKDRTYFASVSKRRLKTDKTHKHTCKGATSPQVVGT